MVHRYRGLSSAFLIIALGLTVLSVSGQGTQPRLRVLSPENLATLYGVELVEFRGVVGPGCKSITVSYFSADGKLVEEYRLKKYLPGSREFLYRAGKSLGNLAMGSNRYLFVALFDDGSSAREEITIFINEYQGERAKPVIYLYPRTRCAVVVRVSPVGGVTKSEPAYRDGWTVTADPDGRIVDAVGASWPYLFWESPALDPPAPLKEGFSVARDGVEAFLREKLAYLGLNEAETADFLEYWLPLMADRAWYAIRFIPRSEIDAGAPLSVSPRPDSVIRVLMDFRGGDAPFALAQQVLEPGRREGFAVVEWGGMRYP